MNLNRVTLIGRLTRPIEIKTSKQGRDIAIIGLATSHSYKDKTTGEKVEQTDFHDLVAYGRLAEVLGGFCVKGQEMFFEGRLTTRRYEREDGTKGKSTQIVVENFAFGSKPKGAAQQDQPEEVQTVADPTDEAIEDIPPF